MRGDVCDGDHTSDEKNPSRFCHRPRPSNRAVTPGPPLPSDRVCPATNPIPAANHRADLNKAALYSTRRWGADAHVLRPVLGNRDTFFGTPQEFTPSPCPTTQYPVTVSISWPSTGSKVLYAGKPQRYCGFVSRPPPYSKYHSKANRMNFLVSQCI